MLPRYTFGLPVITYLKVRNLAIVEELAIEPGPGLNVLTGETGAGKSLLIDSLDPCAGDAGINGRHQRGHDNAEVRVNDLFAADDQDIVGHRRIRLCTIAERGTVQPALRGSEFPGRPNAGLMPEGALRLR